MNCLLAGYPAGTTLDVAAALLAASPGAPVTLLSDDTRALLAVLDRPELAGCEVLWADAAEPGTVDDALVHRRMLHGQPDVVVVVVDEEQLGGAHGWGLAAVLLPRLGGTPLLVVGAGAATHIPRLSALFRDLAGAGGADFACAFVAGTDTDAVLQQAALLVSTEPVAHASVERPLLHGHCAH